MLKWLAGIGVTVLAWIFPRQGQVVRDVRISGGGRHETEGGGNIDVRIEATAHADASISAEVVPATGRAGGRHETRGSAVVTVIPRVG